MIQLYFLSAALTILGGLALALPDRPNPRQFLRHLGFILTDSKVRLTLGILNIVVGVLKIVSPMQGDVRIVGDLFPALAGMLAGLVLLLEFNRGVDEGTQSAVPAEGQAGQRRRKTARILVESGRLIGFVSIVVGVGHFLFPLEHFL